LSGGNHLFLWKSSFLNSNAGRHRTLVFKWYRRRISESDASGVKQGDFVVVGPSSLAAGDDLTDLASNVALLDEAARKGTLISPVSGCV